MSEIKNQYVLTFNDDFHSTNIEISINPHILQQIDLLLKPGNIIESNDTNSELNGTNQSGNAKSKFQDRTPENPLAPVSQISFSIHEDKLLLKASHKKANLLKEYKSAAKKVPNLYPKKNISMQMLKNRLQQLKQEGLRFQVLNRIANEEVHNEHSSEISTLQDVSNEDLLKEVNRRQILKHEQVIENIGAGDALVNIRLNGAEFEETTLQSTEKLLSENSRYLKKILSRMLPRKIEKPKTTKISLDSWNDSRLNENVNHITQNIQFKNVEFSEFSDKYRGEILCDCFHPDIFSRFLTFCENADIQDRYYKSMETWTEFHKESQKSLEDALYQLKNVFNQKLENLTEYIHKERIELSNIYETCLKRDIQRLKILYRAQLNFQQTKFDKILDMRRKELESFYAEEISLTQELYKSHQLYREQQLQKEKKQTEILLNNIIPPNNLVSLFILSDILQADELKTICMNKIADDFNSYKSNEGLSSTLIKPDTFSQLMTRLKTGELLKLAKDIDYTFPTAFVHKEIDYRKSTFKNMLRSKQLPLLIEMCSDPEANDIHFPEIVQEELASRRGAKPYVFIPPSPHVGEDELSLVHLGINRHYITHYATHSRDYAGWSRWFFEVTINELHSDYGTTAHIGWGVRYNDQILPEISSTDGTIKSKLKDFSLKQKIIGITKNHRDFAGYAISTDGMFYSDGKIDALHYSLKSGDVIGCSIDQAKKRLEFYLNGKTIVIGHANFIEIKDPLYELYPAISVYHTHATTQCKLQFNFTGPFKFAPQAVFEAYGHPINARRYTRERQRIETNNNNINVLNEQLD